MGVSFADKKLGLSLSGGGVRAMAFHAGVLKFLAKNEVLKNVTNISSVSGGSLFTGLVFHNAGYKWPDGKAYLIHVLPKIRRMLTTTSIQTEGIRSLFTPENWKNFLHRGEIVADTIEELWGIHTTLKDLPTKPAWAINGTNGENGRRFRFNNATMGDYKTGYTDASDFKLAKAMAVSAAFPIGIGPIEITTGNYVWERETAWGSGVKETVPPVYESIHIYDGGLYDNLGSEAFYEVGEQKIKPHVKDLDFLIISDAGLPFRDTALINPFSLDRAAKLVSILMDQDRSLRVRSFMNYLKNNENAGMYLSLSDQVLESAKSTIPPADIATARYYPTTLDQMTERDFDTLVECGYQVAAFNSK
ncbi:patatin-like phospholipase family protein [Seleniivibrio woodruffii]|uniref:patatin-like phospholipase family protein n=1 Tax=Seleniivibrio woodruffii TaxID=1078050 RepID=UPI0024096653|nr:patatin-like phospholipase family protein [Seleniivibrio woodruffii]